jgi:hypothetical protein
MPEVFNIDDIEHSAAHIKTNANARIVSSLPRRVSDLPRRFADFRDEVWPGAP